MAASSSVSVLVRPFVSTIGSVSMAAARRDPAPGVCAVMKRPRKPRVLPLVQTRLAGERKREEFLIGIAEQSSREAWSRERAESEVRKAAIKAAFADHITTERSFANLVAEGILATDPAVRDHVPRLITLRDEIWSKDPGFLRSSLHGPSQTLIDLMRRQKRPNERHYTASATAYLVYLRRRFAA
jgi:hypothetical protein